MPKQLSIYDNDEQKQDKRPIRILHKPTPDEVRNISFRLDSNTKSDLQMKAEPFLKLMRKYRFCFDSADRSSQKPPIIETFEKSKNQLKADWVRFLALFYEPHNYMLIFEDRPKRDIELWREVLRNHFLIDTEAEKIKKAKCFANASRYYSNAILIPSLKYYFKVTNRKADIEDKYSWRKSSDFIYADTLLQQMLLKNFFPELATINDIEALPDDSSLIRYNGENFIFAKLPIIASLYDNKQLPHTFGKLPVSLVKKAQKIIALPDFFKTDANKQQLLSATQLLSYYIFYRQYMGRKKLPAEPEMLIKSIFNETFVKNPTNAYTLSALLPYLKGIKRKNEYYNYNHVINTLLTLLQNHHAKKWLSVDQLIMNIRTYDYAAESYFILIDPYYLDNMDIRNGYIEDKNRKCYIHPGNIVKQLSEPFIKAIMFTLSTLGLLEIAYREPQNGDTSPYDGLQYVRVTELGKFALGITDCYKPHFADDDTPAFELDDQRLIIRVRDVDSPFRQLLTDYADRIAPSLYCVSYESFLSSCSNHFDVERKVKMFKQFICKTLPPIWEQFMDDIVNRCNPFGMPEDKYMILTIPKDNTDLQRLLLVNPAIRRYVLKAEDYMILVKESDMDKLTNAIKKFGYLA